MEKNFFDKMSDSYESFHLRESEISMGNDTIYISPKMKLALGWSLFFLCCVLAYVFIGVPFGKEQGKDSGDKREVLKEEVNVEEEHHTIVPYEKDGNEDLNVFIEDYFTAMTECDNVALQDMVTDPSMYADNKSLKKKAEFITGYHNITVYTKEALDEGSYVAFVVANLTITGVNSSPYDIITLYVVNGARGYLIHNGELSEDAKAYIEKVKGDKDIQKVYKTVEKKNAELKEADATLKAFYDTISNANAQTADASAGEGGEQPAADAPEGEGEGQPAADAPEGEGEGQPAADTPEGEGEEQPEADAPVAE